MSCPQCRRYEEPLTPKGSREAYQRLGVRDEKGLCRQQVNEVACEASAAEDSPAQHKIATSLSSL